MLFWSRFLQGVVIGVSVAAPVGPMAILCVSRTLLSGPLTGFVSGLAAATVDLFFASVGAFGLRMISGALQAQQSWLRLFGATYLIYLAVKTYRTVPRFAEMRLKGNSNLLTLYLTTVLLNLTNPMTIIPFIAIFAGAGLAGSNNMGAVVLVLGVFIGASFWWIVLSTFCNTISKKFTLVRLTTINQCSAIGLGLFALYTLYRVVIP